MSRFFRFPWATTGDRAIVPFNTDPGGAVSYSQGFGPDYEIAPGDPGWKPVPREETNGLYYDLTDNIRQYQMNGTPDWADPSQNAGIPVSYDYAARVRYDAGDGPRVWQSTTTNNTSVPGADGNWALSEPFNFEANVATDAEVQAGTVNNKIVTPLNLRALTPTTTRPGIAPFATSAEVLAGTEAAKTITPATLVTRTATESRTGLIALATPSEVEAGTESGKAITPASLLYRVASTVARGLAFLATQAEVIAGTDTGKIVTPATLNGRTATADRTGIVELATNAEVATGTDATRAITPAGLRSTLYTGSTRDEVDFPIGHIVNVGGAAALAARNSVKTIYIDNANPGYYRVTAEGPALTGVWRARGGTQENTIYQRVS